MRESCEISLEMVLQKKYCFVLKECYSYWQINPTWSRQALLANFMGLEKDLEKESRSLAASCD